MGSERLTRYVDTFTNNKMDRLKCSLLKYRSTTRRRGGVVWEKSIGSSSQTAKWDQLVIELLGTD